MTAHARIIDASLLPVRVTPLGTIRSRHRALIFASLHRASHIMVDGQGIYDATWGKQYPIQSTSYLGESFHYYEKGPIDIFEAQLEDKILIRQEYDKTYQLLQRLADAKASRGRKPCFVLTGQPGIGVLLRLSHWSM